MTNQYQRYGAANGNPFQRTTCSGAFDASLYISHIRPNVLTGRGKRRKGQQGMTTVNRKGEMAG